MSELARDGALVRHLARALWRRLPGFLTRNLRLKALATGLAMLSWIGVVFAANPPETRTVTVPVPQDAALIPSKFVLVHPIADVAVRVAGTREHLNSFAAGSLVLTVDYHSISHAGTQLVPLSVVTRDRDVELDNPPTAVEAEMDELGSTVVPVSIIISNPPPLGYVTGGQVAEPDRVTVSGPSHRLDGIQARVTIDLSNQKANLQQDFTIFPFDAAGAKLSDLNVSPPTVRVTITVAASATSRATAVVPKTVGAIAADHQLAGVTVEPLTVLLAGPQDLLNSLDAVPTAPITLTGLTSDTLVTVKVMPPAGVRATPDIVTVRIAVVPLPTLPVAPTP